MVSVILVASCGYREAAMSRQLRIQFPGAIYHVTSRGDRRQAIVVDVVRDRIDEGSKDRFKRMPVTPTEKEEWPRQPSGPFAFAERFKRMPVAPVGNQELTKLKVGDCLGNVCRQRKCTAFFWRIRSYTLDVR